MIQKYNNQAPRVRGKKKIKIMIVKVMILQKNVLELTLESNSSAEMPCLKRNHDEKFLVHRTNNMLIRKTAHQQNKKKKRGKKSENNTKHTEVLSIDLKKSWKVMTNNKH